MEKPKEKLWDFPAFLDFLTEEQKSTLKLFAEILWQEAIPLGFIGKTDFQTLWQRHVLESLLPLAVEELKLIFLSLPSLIDLGSGAGLPAIPLAVALPNTVVISVESQKNKATFQEWIQQKLNLKNLTIFADTVENFPEEKKTSLVTFRAFKKILAALELSLYALKPQGLVVYYGAKSFNFGDKERERIKLLGFQEEGFYNLGELPNYPNRCFYTFRLATKPTKPFPRSYRRITKDPLTKGNF